MTNSSDKRQEYRLHAREVVFIEAVSGDEDKSSCIIVSNSLDISANGLRITSSECLPVGSIHSICVQLDNPNCRLQLVIEVKWYQKLESTSEYLIGMELFESEGTDIQIWKEIIAERCYC